MKYFVSYRTTLRISRYLFRTLAFALWSLGALLSIFLIVSALHEKESQIRQDLSANYDQVQWFFHQASEIVRELKYTTESPVKVTTEDLGRQNSAEDKVTPAQFSPLYADADCTSMRDNWRSSLDSISFFLNYWKPNITSSWQLNRVFFTGDESRCLADFSISNASLERQKGLRQLNERISRYHSSNVGERKNNLYWIIPDNNSGTGSLYVVTPVYDASKKGALMGFEKNIRLDDFVSTGNLPIVTTIIDHENHLILSSADEPVSFSLEELPNSKMWFGYANNYKQLVFKKNLPPSSLSVVFSMPASALATQLEMLIINALILNIVSGVILFIVSWLFERRMFLPAEDNAQRLEEHELFNRKIVASAPVGISILRISDGSNILSNELAHNYLNLLTQHDRHRLTEIISDRQVKFIDVLTISNTNLQISFVHSRYRNENVAICVLVDVSARVKMEESLQEMAKAAEQASQSKSMFLATVSHELRTPLYGIIGNLDLLQSKTLPQGVESLVQAMNNSSSLLLKIISDILDFSKIESEQLRIEPRAFSPREVLNHIVSNYLPLVGKKRLTLYCLIENEVPMSLEGDPLRLQQVISNLLNNAIKFTHTGSIILHAWVKEGYLAFRVRDTGVGIPAKEINRLFDPFVQVGNGVQRHFQGTGLGLAICEKLINMMDGDIAVDSEPGMGSQFIVRIPVYKSQQMTPVFHEGLQDKQIWLELRNAPLAKFLQNLLTQQSIPAEGYNEHRCGKDDVIITDYNFTTEHPVRAIVEFNGQHMAMPLEIAAGRWVYSTAMPHEISVLLGRIYRLPVDLLPELSALSTSQQPVSNGDILLLVVDDHPINRMLLSDQLSSLGFQIKTARDGIDALNVMSRNRFDIVLTDVNMPDMDGYRLTQRLRQLGETFPIIGVTANALAEEKQRCLEAGMDDCLSKPVTLETLQQTLAVYTEQVRKKKYSAIIAS